jgi:hypothetical protein
MYANIAAMGALEPSGIIAAAPITKATDSKYIHTRINHHP